LLLADERTSATELVLRWLAEAHAYDSFSRYTESLLDVDTGSYPMDRLAREAKDGAIARARGRPRGEADDAVRRAVLAALVRVQIVLRINVLADEFVTREGLIQAALSAHLALALEPCPSRPAGMDPPLDVVRSRDLLLGRVSELHALEEARGRVEERYLDGTRALFPAGQRAWDEQRHQSEHLAVIAIRLVQLDGHPEPAGEDPTAREARIGRLIADHVEPARSTAYNELGDGRRAASIAVRWLRPSLAVSSRA